MCMYAMHADRPPPETEAQRSVAGLKARVAALEAERDQALGQKAGDPPNPSHKTEEFVFLGFQEGLE